MILFYIMSEQNWAGIGVDKDGSIWFRTGTGLPAQVFRMASNGVMTVKQLNQTSSRRYKENIQPLTEDEAKKILKLEPVLYDQINGESHQYGLVAEDVYKIIPELVMERDGEIESLHYTGLIAPMLKMIQLQEAKIAKLESDIEELKQLLKQ